MCKGTARPSVLAVLRLIVPTSPMDGSPQAIRFDATTLWHLHAAEWAPSISSIASKPIRTGNRCVSAEPRKLTFCALKEVAPPQVNGQLEEGVERGRHAARQCGPNRLSAFSLF